MRRILFYLSVALLAFGILFSCSEKNEVTNKKNEVINNCNANLESNETEIYSILANYWFEHSTVLKGKTTVINSQTYSFKNKHPDISLESPISSEFEGNVVKDFQHKNQESILLNNDLTLSNEYQYLSPETKFYKNDLVKDFVTAYPNAALLIGFSRIGFNENYTKALVYSYSTFDRGGYFELERQNCKWKIVKEINMWVH